MYCWNKSDGDMLKSALEQMQKLQHLALLKTPSAKPASIFIITQIPSMDEPR